MKKLLNLVLMFLSIQGFAQTPVFKSISPSIQTNGGFIIIHKGVVASNGDYYIIGNFNGLVDFDPGPNVVNAPDPFNYQAADSYNDAFIAKYSSSDALLWVKAMWTRGAMVSHVGTELDPLLFFNDVTIGADGNVYFIGDIKGTADGIGTQVNGLRSTAGEFTRAFARGLNPAGSLIFSGANTYGGIGIDYSNGEGIAADGSGNVFITGFQSGDVNGIYSGSQQHAYYAKFNGSGVRINQGWMIQTSTTPSDFNSNRHSRGNAIAVDGSGNIYITGFFGQSADFDPGAGTNIINSINLKDAFIAKWTSSNALSWVRTYSTASEGTEIELDANGNVYAAVGNNFIKLTNAGADSWNRNLGYAHSFTINASNELLVARTNTQMRFLKLSAANAILYEIAPTYVSGFSTNANRSFVAEYGNGDVRWINNSVSNYDYGNGPSGELGYGAFIRYGIGNSAPTNILLSASSINENNAINAVIGNLTTTDANPGDSHTYSLVSGTGSTDNASFNISGNQLRAGIAFNFEAKSSYSIRVRSNDGEATFDKVFTITINDVAEDLTAPTVVSLSPLDDATNVPVNSNFAITFNEPISLLPGAVLVGFFKNGALDFTLGTNSPFVNVSGNTLTIDLNDDLLPATAYAIYFNPYIQDMSGNVVTTLNNQTFWNFTTAAAANSAPTNIILSAASINENNAVNAVIGTLSTTDSDVGDSHTYSLVAGTGSTDNASFNISGNQLRASTVFDYETKTSYSIRVRTNDGTATFEKVFSITVLDVTDTDVTPPTIVSLSPADNTTGVAVNSNLVITFNEPIFPVSPSPNLIRLVDFETDNAVENFDPENNGDGRVTISGNTLTLNPTNNLLHSKQYYIISNENVLQDAAGNKLPEIFDKTTWNFTTAAAAAQNQTITFAALPEKTFGDASFNLTATASSNLPVSYESNNTNVATVSGNTVTIIAAGSALITASQAGNSGFNAAPSVSRMLTVNPADQTITFVALPSKTFGDASFNLTATSSSGLPVTFTSTNPGVAAVSGNTVTIVSAGSTNIRANQSGNVNYNAASQVQRTLTVNKANQTITITPIADKATTDGSFAVSANTTSGLSLVYSIASGPATISGTTISLNGTSGTVNVQVDQAGNNNYNSATANTTFNVTDPNKTDQAITFEALASKTFGDADFELSATASSGLTVSYISSNNAVATISGSTVTIVGAGSTTIMASQLGDDTFNPAVSVEQVLTVSKADQTITIGAIADKLTTDVPFEVVATTTSNLALSYSIISGPATNNGSTIALDGTVGTVVVEVNQAGNTNFNTATAQVSFDVTEQTKQDQTITIEAIADKLTTDTAFDVVASTTSGLTLTYEVSGPASIAGTTITLDGTSGEVTVTVSQAGDDNYNPATAQTSFEVTDQPVKQDQTIAFNALAAVTFGDASFDLSAVASSGLSVTYTSTDESVVTIDGTTVSIIGAGSAIITASQAGDDNFNAAVAINQELVVNKASQTITFSAIESQFIEAGSVGLTATSSAGLAVSFEIVSGPATVNGNTVSFSDVGTVVVSASQAGDDNHLSAESVEQLFEVITVTGVANRLQDIQVNVYPNPVTTQLSISGINKDVQIIRLTDLNGREVRRLIPNGSQVQLELSDLKQGIYMLQITTSEEVKSQRIIKR